MIAGQHFRFPKAVAEVDRDPASEIDQEEGRAVGEQERQYSRPGRRSKTLSYPKLFFTCLHFVIKKFQCYGLSFKKRLVPRRGNNNCLTPEIHTVFSSVRLSVLRKLVQVASPSAMYTNTILPCRRTRKPRQGGRARGGRQSMYHVMGNVSWNPWNGLIFTHVYACSVSLLHQLDKSFNPPNTHWPEKKQVRHTRLLLKSFLNLQ